MSHTRETLEETRRKAPRGSCRTNPGSKTEELEGITEQEGEDGDANVIIQRGKTIIIEEEKEIEDSQPKKGKRLRILIPARPTPPTPPTPPSLPPQIPWQTGNNADSHVQTESA